MTTIVTRSGKGSPLSHTEMDANLTNLNNDKIEASAITGMVTATGSATFTNKTIAFGSNTISSTLAQLNSAVTDADVASLTGVETLTNKTINLSSNTLSTTVSQLNTAITDGDITTLTGIETLSNKTVALGSNSISGTLSQFNTSCTDADFATIAGTETLTNKTMTTPVINGFTGDLKLVGVGSLGYGVGSGGSVTQITSKTTAVTLNKATGQIITDGAALASNTTINFVFNNTTITNDDVVFLTSGDGNGLSYSIWAYNTGTGSCNVAVRNITAGSLSHALPIKFVVIKGSQT